MARAIFTDTRLNKVDFAGAYTFLTRFEGVDLRNTQQLTQTQLDIACGDDETLLPEGLSRPLSWPCVEG